MSTRRKYRVTVLATVTYEAHSSEDAELKMDNVVNLKALFADNGMHVERSMTDVYDIGPAKEKE